MHCRILLSKIILTRVILSLVLSGVLISNTSASSFPYCEIPGAKKYIIFLDRTTQFDDADKKYVVEAISSVHDGLNFGDRIVVQTITGDFAASEGVFDACKPGCPKQSFWQRLLGAQCREIVARKDAIDFRSRFAASVIRLLSKEEEYPRSQIIRTMNFVFRQYQGVKFSGVYLYSDLIENSSIAKFLNLRRSDVPTLLDALTRRELIPAIPDAAVQAFGFGRGHAPGRRGLSEGRQAAIQDFWRQYFKRGGAKSVEIRMRAVSP